MMKQSNFHSKNDCTFIGKFLELKIKQQTLYKQQRMQFDDQDSWDEFYCSNNNPPLSEANNIEIQGNWNLAKQGTVRKLTRYQQIRNLCGDEMRLLVKWKCYCGETFDKSRKFKKHVSLKHSEFYKLVYQKSKLSLRQFLLPPTRQADGSILKVLTKSISTGQEAKNDPTLPVYMCFCKKQFQTRRLLANHYWRCRTDLQPPLNSFAHMYALLDEPYVDHNGRSIIKINLGKVNTKALRHWQDSQKRSQLIKSSHQSKIGQKDLLFLKETIESSFKQDMNLASVSKTDILNIQVKAKSIRQLQDQISKKEKMAENLRIVAHITRNQMINR